VDETKWKIETAEQRRWLLEALISTGTGPAQAWRIVEVLEDLPEQYSRTFSVSMTAYRKRLALVGRPPWDDDPDKLPCISSERAA
jgi:hypothetical protein